MLTYAETFEPVDVQQTAAVLTPQQALLKNLGLIVIGEHDGQSRIEVFSENTNKSVTIPDIDKLSVAKLIQITGPEAVDEHVHDGKEPQPGKCQIKDVRNAIAGQASGKRFYADEQLGAGVWEVDNTLLLLKSKQAGILNGSGKIEVSHMPFFNGRVLDLGPSAGDWCDFAVMNRLLAMVQSDEFCRRTFSEAESLFKNWTWRKPETPRVVAALVCCSFVQSLWDWRRRFSSLATATVESRCWWTTRLTEGFSGRCACTW